MPSAPKNLLTILLASSSPMVVREYAARLVNCLSCECSGRAYLLQNRQVTSLLWGIFLFYITHFVILLNHFVIN